MRCAQETVIVAYPIKQLPSLKILSHKIVLIDRYNHVVQIHDIIMMEIIENEYLLFQCLVHIFAKTRSIDCLDGIGLA